MITHYPTPFDSVAPVPATPRPPRQSAPATAKSVCHYESSHISRSAVVFAILVSAGLHATLFFGPLLAHRKAARVVIAEPLNMIRLSIPELKELEEPDPAPSDDSTPVPDLAIPVPMQSDLPQLARPNDFVQPLNLASLLEKPDLSQANISIIPASFTRATRIAESIGKIFNPEDLDRQPEPVLQPSPTYPFGMRREGLSASVVVEFIVDVEGRVLEVIVFDSTHTSFNEAAVTGVSRWKFRPGIKNGRKVNTRMRVPIVFKVMDAID